MADHNKSENINCFKKDILLNLLWDSVIKNKWPQPLGNKLRQIISHWDTMAYITEHHNKTHDEPNCIPLDLELKRINLTLDEKKTVQLELEKHIINTFPDILNEFDKLTNGQIKKYAKNTYNVDLTHEQKKIIHLCTKYYEDLQEMLNINIEFCTLMKEWIDIRLSVMIKNLERKAEINKYKCIIKEIEGKILNVQLKRFVYGGKISSVKDYIEYYNGMKEKLGEYKKQILNYKRMLHMDDDFFD